MDSSILWQRVDQSSTIYCAIIAKLKDAIEPSLQTFTYRCSSLTIRRARLVMKRIVFERERKVAWRKDLTGSTRSDQAIEPAAGGKLRIDHA
jgi:hypothetical protein